VRINRLQVNNFRCISDQLLQFDHLNIVVGNNGQGKTSLLESIYLLAFTKSHKTSSEKEVIQSGSDFCKVEAAIEIKDMNYKFGISMTKSKKKVMINSDEQKKLSEYIGHINVVMFSPDDLRIIKGEPGIKRKFIDVELGQTSPLYIKDLLIYKNILKQRNELLKELEVDSDLTYLDVLTDQLLDYAKRIVDSREEFILAINKHIDIIHGELTNHKEHLKVVYKTKHKKSLVDELKAKYQYDIITGATSLGPHRDDLVILVNDEDVSVYGSQGQQRTAVLSLKLGLIDFIHDILGVYPILLLDDVFSELDQNRLNSLVGYIKPEIQTFITTTDINLIKDELINKAKLFSVIKGSFEGSELHERI
jgi:DNA replication and repair protein RecF